ncbi:hypothetical protein, partial [Pseudomonas savastanoi]
MPKHPSDISIENLLQGASGHSRLRGGTWKGLKMRTYQGAMRVQGLLAGVLVLALVLELAQ